MCQEQAFSVLFTFSRIFFFLAINAALKKIQKDLAHILSLLCEDKNQ